MQVEKESKSVGLEKEDAMNRASWRVAVGDQNWIDDDDDDDGTIIDISRARLVNLSLPAI